MWLEVRPQERVPTGYPPVSIAAESFFDAAPSVESVKNTRTSNAASLQELYCRDLRMLLTIIRRVVRSPSDAEDIVQDAFLRVWRAMELGLVRSPRAVLFKTAYNLALNHLRNPRNCCADVASVSAEPVHDVPTAEEQMIVDEEAQACRVAFNSLPQRCRETLALRVVDELSYKEMSERLGLSVSTLEKHFIRGRRLCRDILQGQAESGRAAPTRRGRPAPRMMLAAAE
jgi:RNA polymerase sigma factor (sigma-70 family)